MRNLGIIVALWMAVLLPPNALALGLGEIEVNSFLNQPLNAEIQVISARPGEIDDLLVSLASREAFSRAGLSRPRNLSDLRFAVRANEEGDKAVIIVTTKTAIKEPFLNFLIEADWSKGRVLREFTILLDPPFYADQPPPIESSSPALESSTTLESLPESRLESLPESTLEPLPDSTLEPLPPEQPLSEDASVTAIVEQAGVTAADTRDTATSDTLDSSTDDGGLIVDDDEFGDSSDSITEPIALGEEASDLEPLSDEFVEQEPQNIIEDDVLVVKGDTLWSIASRYRDEAFSMSQLMLAFQRANPDAFNDGNINNLKEGAILRTPSIDEIAAFGKQQAYAEVLVQNGLWDDYVVRVTGAVPVTATEGLAADAGPDSDFEPAEDTTDAATEAEADPSGDGGELSLLLPGDGGGESTGIGESAELEELRTRLALTEEELDASRIENQDLESRVAELEAQLSKLEELQKMVEIEDDSLALLQDREQSLDADSGVTEIAEVDTAPEPEIEPEIDQEGEAAEDELALVDPINEDEEALIEELLAEEAEAQELDRVIDGSSAEDDDTLIDQELDEIFDDEQPLADTDSQPPPPEPVIITELDSQTPSIFDGILPSNIVDMIPSMPAFGGMFADPLILGSVGGGLVVVLLLVFLIARRRSSADDDDSSIVVSGDFDTDTDDNFFSADEEEELTPISLADNAAADQTGFKMPDEDGGVVADEAADDFAAGEISQLDIPESQPEFEPEPEAAAPAPATAEQDDVLNEVDVYLAYGLYDNAEELLVSNLNDNPDRADYRSKLLDTYFATKKNDQFVKEAENLKSMGDAGAAYWSRVQVMGYELLPDNPLFSDAKDSGLSAADLEISRPQEADFDLGAGEEDETNFSSTDFNLGEVAGDDAETAGDADDVAATQQIPQLDDLPGFDDEDDLNVPEEVEDLGLDLPDDIGAELEFDMDEGGEEPAEALDLADDLDLGGGDTSDFDLDDSELMDFDDASDDDPLAESAIDDDLLIDDDLGDLALDDSLAEAELDDDLLGDIDEDAVELDVAEFENEDAAISDYGDDDLMSEIGGMDLDDDSDMDFGMDDSSMTDTDETSLATGELNLDTGELELPIDDEFEDDDEDISIIDFGGEDFIEPTDIVSSIEGDDESLAYDVDIDDGDDIQTGTFAPGDFEEPTAATSSIADIDDISEFMLPDDVDEVSTKLDLARAFIDMGDTEGARGSLEEVMSEGNEEQKAEARSLLEQT